MQSTCTVRKKAQPEKGENGTDSEMVLRTSYTPMICTLSFLTSTHSSDSSPSIGKYCVGSSKGRKSGEVPRMSRANIVYSARFRCARVLSELAPETTPLKASQNALTLARTSICGSASKGLGRVSISSKQEASNRSTSCLSCGILHDNDSLSPE